MCLIVLLCSAAFCIYTVAGYPLLLALLARSRPRPVRKAPWQAPVSVILPVRNGERWIGAKLESILGLNYPPELKDKIGPRNMLHSWATATDDALHGLASNLIHGGPHPPAPHGPPQNLVAFRCPFCHAGVSPSGEPASRAWL